MTDPPIKLEEFRNDDRAYLDWVARNPRGFVINIQRSLNSSDARLHRAACHTVTGTPPRGRTWTGPYIKVCSLDLGSLDDWATRRTRAPIKRCGTCHPPAHAPEKPDAPPAIPAVNPQRPPQAIRPSQTPIATPASARHHRWEIRGPSSANPTNQHPQGSICADEQSAVGPSGRCGRAGLPTLQAIFVPLEWAGNDESHRREPRRVGRLPVWLRGGMLGVCLSYSANQPDKPSATLKQNLAQYCRAAL